MRRRRSAGSANGAVVLPLPQGRSFTWLAEQELSYSNWKDGEPNQMAGCGHMTTSGQWTVTPCDAKMDAAICEISGMCFNQRENRQLLTCRQPPPPPDGCAYDCSLRSGDPLVHQWTYSGQCPHTLGDWAWVPFRNHCYAFNLHSLRLQQEARLSCKKGEEPQVSRELHGPSYRQQLCQR